MELQCVFIPLSNWLHMLVWLVPNYMVNQLQVGRWAREWNKQLRQVSMYSEHNNLIRKNTQ